MHFVLKKCIDIYLYLCVDSDWQTIMPSLQDVGDCTPDPETGQALSTDWLGTLATDIETLLCDADCDLQAVRILQQS